MQRQRQVENWNSIVWDVLWFRLPLRKTFPQVQKTNTKKLLNIWFAVLECVFIILFHLLHFILLTISLSIFCCWPCVRSCRVLFTLAAFFYFPVFFVSAVRVFVTWVIWKPRAELKLLPHTVRGTAAVARDKVATRRLVMGFFFHLLLFASQFNYLIEAKVYFVGWNWLH